MLTLRDGAALDSAAIEPAHVVSTTAIRKFGHTGARTVDAQFSAIARAAFAPTTVAPALNPVASGLTFTQTVHANVLRTLALGACAAAPVVSALLAFAICPEIAAAPLVAGHVSAAGQPVGK